MSTHVPVSIIVPVFNAEKHIRRTLKSLSEQTLKGIEIILVDDASSDSSHAVIGKFQQQYDIDLVCIKQPSNRGAYNSRLLGIQHSRGDFIGFVDSDDYIEPEMYEKMYQHAVNHCADVVICNADQVTTSGKLVRSVNNFKNNNYFDDNIFEKFCNYNFGPANLWSKLYKREIVQPFSQHYLPWRQVIAEDCLLNVGFFSLAKSVYVMEDVFYHYVENPLSATKVSNPENWFVELFKSFALALSVYDHIADDHRKLIAELYRFQLQTQSACSVGKLSVLELKYEDLKKAIDVVYQHWPIGLALISSPKPINLSGRQALRVVLNRICKKLNL